MNASQKMYVKKWLKSHKSGITSAEAFEKGITRLSGIIWRLRHDEGMKIESIRERCQNRYGRTANYVRYVYTGGKE